MRLLLVEDSPKLAEWLARALRDLGYAVDAVGDGQQADGLLRTQAYDLVVLDLTLPSLDGLGVLQRLRDRGSTTPVMVLSARADLQDRVRGLKLGADDYLTKPFDLSELEARLQALVRRAHGRGASRVQVGPLAYDPADRSFRLGGERLALRPKEHAVLEVLVLRPGKATPKAQIHEHVFAMDETTGPDVVEIYIHRLRKQLAGRGVAIVTLRGLGYLLEAEGTP